jgi:hypothetical protein|tara:strand:+ start:3421 stop:3579 length:159 start_codon:yes stop_codon:yes gene_type:complete
MKEFRVENVVMDTTIIVTLYKPPYEDDDILKYTDWKLKDVTITEITMERDDE